MAKEAESLVPKFLIRRPLPAKSGVLLQCTDDGEWHERDIVLQWPTMEIRIRGSTDLVYPVDVLHQSVVLALPSADCLFNEQRVFALQILSREDDSVILLFSASGKDREDWTSVLRKQSVHVDVENGFQLDGRILGTGNYASVYLAHDIIQDKNVALKVIEKSRLTEEERKLLADEVLVSKAADHSFCVQTLEFIELGEQYVLVVEYMEGGDLYDRVVCEQYGSVDVKHLFRQLLIGVAHLHSRDLCHRDLKPENFLLTGEKPFSVKIADFGIATRVDPNNRSKCLKDGDRLRCSPGYGAPEIVRREAYGQPADMWSVGVLLYFMLTGLSPFHGSTKDETLKLMAEGVYDRAPLKKHGLAVLDLVCRLLELNPDKRLTAEQALKHRWVREAALMTVEEPEAEDQDRSSHGGVPARLLGTKLEGAFRNPSLHEMSVEVPKDPNLYLDVSVHDSFWKSEEWLKAPSPVAIPSTIDENKTGAAAHSGADCDSDVGSCRSSIDSQGGRPSMDSLAGAGGVNVGGGSAKGGKKSSSKFAPLGMISMMVKKVQLKPKGCDDTVQGFPCGE